MKQLMDYTPRLHCKGQSGAIARSVVVGEFTAFTIKSKQLSDFFQ
jgi:hypothetical protein